MKPPRTLPNHPEAEASVLGGIFLRSELIAQLDTLEVDDFYDMRHAVVWQAMRNLEVASKPVDVVTVGAEIARQGKLDAVGGYSMLGELAARVPTADNVVAYAEIVQSKRRARDLMLAANEIYERGYEDGLDVEEYLSESIAKVSRIDRAKPQRARTAGEMAKARIAELEERAAAKERGEAVLNGVPSGIESLDADIGGYPLGDLSIIAARPGMGKTAMAMSSIDAASAMGMGVHVFSAEGGWRMAADRMLSRASKVPVTRLRSADLRAEDGLGLAQAALRYVKRANWLHDDTPGLSVTEVIRRVRKERKRLGTKAVFVDYLTILKYSRGLEEHEALNEIVTLLAQFAVDEDIAVVGLAQLNRKVEDRTDKRPTASDIRGSGALEERPRMIVSPYRGAEYYSEPKEGIDYECTCIAAHMKGGSCVCAPTAEQFARMVKVLMLKNSNGAKGHYDATWIPETVEMH
jgi:replicative DNA helicase